MKSDECHQIFRLTNSDLKNISCIFKFDPYDDKKETKWYYLRDAWELSFSKHGDIVENWYKDYESNKNNQISFKALYSNPWSIGSTHFA